MSDNRVLHCFYWYFYFTKRCEHFFHHCAHIQPPGSPLVRKPLSLQPLDTQLVQTLNTHAHSCMPHTKLSDFLVVLISVSSSIFLSLSLLSFFDSFLFSFCFFFLSFCLSGLLSRHTAVTDSCKVPPSCSSGEHS